MKIFLSYGRDSNAPLNEKIKEYLSKEIIPHEHRTACRVSQRHERVLSFWRNVETNMVRAAEYMGVDDDY